jgi:predicted RNA binding protein YcfA (HicA-like mRNA interferase family)
LFLKCRWEYAVARTLTAREVVGRIKTRGGYHIRTKGSHATYEVIKLSGQGEVIVRARAQVPVHAGDVPPGTLRAIQRQLEPVLGEGWLIR